MLYINNPMDLLQTLVFGYPGQVNDYAPRVHRTAPRPRQAESQR